MLDNITGANANEWIGIVLIEQDGFELLKDRFKDDFYKIGREARLIVLPSGIVENEPESYLIQ